MNEAQPRKIRRTSPLGQVFHVGAILSGRGIKLKSDSLKNVEDTLIKSSHVADIAYDFIWNKGTKNLDDCEIFYKKSEFKAEEYDKKRSTTLEWFVSQLLTSEFGFHSATFGVEIESFFKTIELCDEPAGDFDVIGISRDLEPIFIECKSGNFCNLKQKHLFNVALRGLAVQSPYSILVLEKKVEVARLKSMLNGVNWPNSKDAPASRPCNVDYIYPMNKPQSDHGVYMWGTTFIVSMFNECDKPALYERLANVFKIVGALRSGWFWAGVSYQAAHKNDLLNLAGFKVDEI